MCKCFLCYNNLKSIPDMKIKITSNFKERKANKKKKKEVYIFYQGGKVTIISCKTYNQKEFLLQLI